MMLSNHQRAAKGLAAVCQTLRRACRALCFRRSLEANCTRTRWIGTPTESISAALQRALSDPSCTAIVLEFDSPGGSVGGTPELADEIFRARARKPVVAAVNGMAGSAAYWLASQCSEIVVTPSGEVGSIGVFMLHVDMSASLAQAGIKPTFIHAGKHKVDGNSLQPLSTDAEANWQGQVDAIYGDFLRAVARGRGVPVQKVRAEFGQGRTLQARNAVAIGMADRVGTRGDAIARAAAGAVSTSTAAGTGSAASDRRARLAQLARTVRASDKDARVKQLRDEIATGNRKNRQRRMLLLELS